jgi:DNA replication protein DnaC
MPNYLKMPKKAQVLALLELGWSYRRIEAETGVRRDTVSGYDAARQATAAKTFPGSDPSPPPNFPDVPIAGDSKAAKTFAGSPSNPAKTFPGSAPRRRFAAALYGTAIAEKLDAGLSLQRIWQDLVEEYGYGASYESVKRFVRTIAPTRRAVGVFHCAPGDEAQVDFFRGAPTLDAATGEWRRPWVFRMTLGHSRYGYEEAVWDQKLEFLELLVEDELARRADRLFARRLKQAGITVVKALADFDWHFNPKIPKAKIVELASARFVQMHAGVLLIGPPGVGKSHIATAIAVGAIRAGHRALVRSTFDLAADFAQADATGARRDFVQQLPRVDLLVLEDFGMKKLGSNAAEDLLEVFVRRHETASTLITTNRPTQDWGIFLGDVPAATAILDRFLAHATIVPVTGKSYRLRQRASMTND